MPPGSVALQSGVSALWFTFEGDPQNYGFASMTKEPGDAHLQFADWKLDIFSPDGAYVLLLQDDYGPYHIVATSKLKAYLTAGAKPDYVVPESFAQNEAPHTYSGGHWVSEKSIEFTVSSRGSRKAQSIRFRHDR